jgi:serralysin
LNASDPDGDILSYTLLGGNDLNKFNINISTGVLDFVSPPDFESPDDNNSDNIYEVIAQVTDGDKNASINLYVHVIDMFENDAPSFQSDGNLSVYENQLFVYEFNATDPERAIT